MKGALWLTLLLTVISGTAHADQDIVYAARYYTSPGSHRTSHFHLYRINPDGTGKMQLTFGEADDDDPKWSPDGRWIAFARQNSAFQDMLCLVSARGGTVKVLVKPVNVLLKSGAASNFDNYDYRWSPEGKQLAVAHSISGGSTVSLINPQTGLAARRFVGASDFLWSPNGHYAYLVTASGDEVLDLRTGQVNHVRTSLAHPVWLGQSIVGLGFRTGEKSENYSLRFLNTQGRDIKEVKLSFLPADQSFSFGEDSEELQLVPSSQQTLTYKLYTHRDKDWFFFRMNAASGVTTYMTEGQFLAWSPNGSRFCTTSPMNTVPYKKRRWAFPETLGEPADERITDEYLMVWATPLFVRATQGGPTRQLTPRLSWVTAADWRRSPKTTQRKS